MSIFNTTISGGGTTPTGSISITNNGTYDVTDKATAVVNVPTTAPAHYIEKTVDANGVLQSSPNIINLNGVTDVGDSVLAYAYYTARFPANTGLSLPFTTISGGGACQAMFQSCTGLTSAGLPALTTISGSEACSCMFYLCTGITSVGLPALTTISGATACYNMFFGCAGLTSVGLPALTTISGYDACNAMFQSCGGITSANLPALTECGDYSCEYMFSGCTSLATVYIGGTTAITFGQEPFSSMFDGCPQNIDVYAPAANQTEIEAMDGYPNFGGTGNVVWHWRS